MYWLSYFISIIFGCLLFFTLFHSDKKYSKSIIAVYVVCLGISLTSFFYYRNYVLTQTKNLIHNTNTFNFNNNNSKFILPLSLCQKFDLKYYNNALKNNLKYCTYQIINNYNDMEESPTIQFYLSSKNNGSTTNVFNCGKINNCSIEVNIESQNYYLNVSESTTVLNDQY